MKTKIHPAFVVAGAVFVVLLCAAAVLTTMTAPRTSRHRAQSSRIKFDANDGIPEGASNGGVTISSGDDGYRADRRCAAPIVGTMSVPHGNGFALRGATGDWADRRCAATWRKISLSFITLLSSSPQWSRAAAVRRFAAALGERPAMAG